LIGSPRENAATATAAAPRSEMQIHSKNFHKRMTEHRDNGHRWTRKKHAMI
jgi:hypothetical protein